MQKISRLGSITNVSTPASTTSVPSTFNVIDNAHNDATAAQSGNSQHSVLTQKFLINDCSGSVKQMTGGTEFVTSTSTTDSSTLQVNMLLDAKGGSEFDNFTEQTECHGRVCLLQNRRIDPLLSSAGVDLNWKTTGTTNSTLNAFSQIMPMNQTSQSPTPIITSYTTVSSDLIISCQGSQVYSRFLGYVNSTFLL